MRCTAFFVRCKARAMRCAYTRSSLFLHCTRKLTMSTTFTPSLTHDNRIQHAGLRQKVMSAEAAAALIPAGAVLGMSGFTGSGYPKALPQALAQRIEAERAAGRAFDVGVWTGASTAPELDGALAPAMRQRLPYQSDPAVRRQINAGAINYIDMHLSHVAPMAQAGFLGRMDVAVIEVAGILADGRLVPTTSLGNNQAWLDMADKVILEVNAWQSVALEGMHDVYRVALPPAREPIPLTAPGQSIGTMYMECDPDKIIAIIETDATDRNSPFKAPDADSQRIAAHIIDFLQNEVKHGRLPANLLPLQSGVGNIANAVLAGLNESHFEGLTAYTEVLQDGMLRMIESGKLTFASATALSLSPEATEFFNKNIEKFRGRVLLRPQDVSNHPEVIRRLGVLAMNAMIEADIYGNINSTHVMGSAMMNGIGGSGDFARNAYISFFMSPSVAKGGAISCIVPMVSHTDHTEHDVQVLVTEQGLADLRGLAPVQRAKLIIEKCAHPDYRDALRDYLKDAQ